MHLSKELAIPGGPWRQAAALTALFSTFLNASGFSLERGRWKWCCGWCMLCLASLDGLQSACCLVMLILFLCCSVNLEKAGLYSQDSNPLWKGSQINVCLWRKVSLYSSMSLS